MSLCIVLRAPDGGVMMAADTAVSTEIGGVTYRVSDMEDCEKIIEHNGVLVFCSGDIDKCKKIRAFIRSSNTVNLIAVSEYARMLFGGSTNTIGTGILACWEDGSLVGMLSAQNFRLTPIPWNRDKIDYFALGFHQEKVYPLIEKYLTVFADENYTGMKCIGNVFHDVNDEEVGGNIHLYSRKAPGEPWSNAWGRMDESYRQIRTITKAEALTALHPHGIITAKDFILQDGRSVLTGDKSKISGEYIDARGINIMDSQGHQVLYIDETGIHWTPKYSPFKYQYAVSESGPWHDDPASNDEYRRESCDGGITWGRGIKYIAKDGQDGKPGSDANVTFANIKAALQKAASTQSTFITADEVGAPNIYGGKIYGATMYSNEFNVFPEDGKASSGGLALFGNINGGSTPYEMFRIRYVGQGNAGPAVTISAQGATHTYWNMANTHFSGSFDFEGAVDFSSASVTGIHATFA